MLETYQIHFETLGCKLNQIESEASAHFFSEAGYECTMHTVIAKQEPNFTTLLCVVNTCTVTSKAEQKGRRIIRLLLDKYPKAAILVTGCYAQLDSKILSNIDSRIAILGGQSKGEISDLPAKLTAWYTTNELEPGDSLHLASKLRLLYAGTAEIAFGKPTPNKLQAIPHAITHPDDTFSLSTSTFLSHSRSSIKIQDGCNNHCAYCRICFARGPSVSLDATIVLKRIQNLEKAGHNEVVITGVNLTQYKVAIPQGQKTLSKNRDFFDFADLLHYLLENTHKIKFRISSLYPERVDSEMCSILSHKRVQPHFHLSVQSGSDSILYAMHRPYKAQQVIYAVEQLRKIKENPFIACDIIAGFPNESQNDFDKTVAMVQTCNFTWIHAFPFSARPGTEAYTIKNQIPKQIAKQRVQLLTAIAQKAKQTYIQTCIGKEYSAIVEKRADRDIRVVTENFLHLVVAPSKNKKNLISKLGGTQVTITVLNSLDNKDIIEELDGFCDIITE